MEQFKLQQHTLKSPKGTKKPRKRVGRGDGSGSGSYSGRGVKGQKSRSGGGVKAGFQGGQLSLLKRLPSIRGFTNVFRKEYAIVNLEQFSTFAPDSEVTPDVMLAAGLIKNMNQPIKVLGRGKLEIPLIVSAQRFSNSARQTIESAGGRAEQIS